MPGPSMACKDVDLTSFMIPVQFSWRPSQAAGEPAEAAVVTGRGRLLHATLGGQLESHRDASTEVVSSAAWSLDGSLLAVASSRRIIVADVDKDVVFRAAAKLPVSQSTVILVSARVMRAHLSFMPRRSFEVDGSLLAVASSRRIVADRDKDVIFRATVKLPVSQRGALG